MVSPKPRDTATKTVLDCNTKNTFLSSTNTHSDTHLQPQLTIEATAAISSRANAWRKSMRIKILMTSEIRENARAKEVAIKTTPLSSVEVMEAKGADCPGRSVVPFEAISSSPSAKASRKIND
jgi:hypothetical protein